MAHTVPEAYMTMLQDINDLATDLLSEGAEIDPLERDPVLGELVEKANALINLIKEAT